jgi:cytochrome b subunit of formate dehydrogenase
MRQFSNLTKNFCHITNVFFSFTLATTGYQLKLADGAGLLQHTVKGFALYVIKMILPMNFTIY